MAKLTCQGIGGWFSALISATKFAGKSPRPIASCKNTPLNKAALQESSKSEKNSPLLQGYLSVIDIYEEFVSSYVIRLKTFK